MRFSFTCHRRYVAVHCLAVHHPRGMFGGSPEEPGVGQGRMRRCNLRRQAVAVPLPREGCCTYHKLTVYIGCYINNTIFCCADWTKSESAVRARLANIRRKLKAVIPRK